MDFDVRRATGTDRDAIRQLLRQLHPDAAHRSQLPTIRQDSQTFLATDDSGVIGLAVATFVDYGIEAYGIIEEVLVDESRRGAGVGRSLLRRCDEWFTENGADVVFVSALKEAERLYLESGFSRCTGPWLFQVPKKN